jgi:TonB family protein
VYYRKTYKNIAEKYFRLSLFLSLFFHFFLAFFFVSSLSLPTTSRHSHTNFFIEATLITQPKIQEKSIIATREIKNAIFTSAKNLVIKPISSVKSKRTKKDFIAKNTIKNAKFLRSKFGGHMARHINAESLRDDIRSVARNIAFGSSGAFSVLPEKTKISLESAYRRYVDACSSKIAYIGNIKNKEFAEGTVMLTVTIEKSGRVSERHITSSSSKNLNIVALEIVDTASPFGPFPKDLLRENIKISPRVHFVIQ